MQKRPNLLKKTLGKLFEMAGFEVTFDAVKESYSVDLLASHQGSTVIIDCIDASGYVGVHTFVYNMVRKQKVFNSQKSIVAFYNLPLTDYNLKVADKSGVEFWSKSEVDLLLDAMFHDKFSAKVKLLELVGLHKPAPVSAVASEIAKQQTEQARHAAPEPARQAASVATTVHPISLGRYSNQTFRPDMEYVLNDIFTLIFQSGLKKIDGLKTKKGHFMAYKGRKPPYVLHTPRISSMKYNLDEIASLLGSIKQKEGDIDYLLAYTVIGNDILSLAEKNNVRCIVCDGIERRGVLSRDSVFDRGATKVCVITTDDLVDYIRRNEKR